MRFNRRLTGLAALVAAFTLLAAACGDDDDTSTSPTTDGGTETTAAGGSFDYSSLPTATVNGTGASFPDVFYQKAIADFKDVASQVTVNYTKSGSSAGRQDLQNEVVNFAGSDSLPKDDETYQGGEILLFPTVAAPITISYNLPGVDELRLDAETIAGIFQTDITTWDDPAIADQNPDVTLPSTAITVVHRSDGSGTTNNFTKYLVAAAADTWTLESGDTVEWPTSTQGAEKNSGVASLISTTEGAVGYVDLADSVNADLQQALVKNADGEYVAPTLDAASAALAGAEINDDLSYNPLNASGPDAYPITAPTWIIVYENQTDSAIGDGLKGWLTYLLTDAQTTAPTVGFAPLPADLQAQALAQVDSIVVG